MSGPRLWYERHGTGIPLVLLHGLGDSHDLWRHVVRPLSECADVVAVDLRGHGRSHLGTVPFALDDMATDVAGLIDALSLEAPVVAGLSMGGGVAQTLALQRPSLPRGLVLVSTSSDFPASTRQRMRLRADKAEREGMAAVVDETVPRWFTPAFAERHPDEVARTRETVLATSSRAFAAASRANAARDLTGRLREIRCPVLFVGGSADPADSYRAEATYRRVLTRFEAELIPGTSHLVPVEAPGRLTALMTAFLGKVASSGPAPSP